MAPFSSLIFVVLGAVFIISARAEGSKKPEDMSQEAYCMGCEYTIKAIDKLLREPTESNLDEQVAEVIQNVCHEDVFEGAEIESETLLGACQYIVTEYENILEGLLTLQYKDVNEISHLDLSQQICLHLTKACEDVDASKRYPEHLDAGVVYDEDSKTFRVMGSKNLRVPIPIKEDL